MSSQTVEVKDAVLMQEGDGVEVQRLFPLRAGRMNYDPFVLWDHFSISPGTGFPTHPHRGFEAITYMFSGGMEHKDNLGNQSTVGVGGAQRFTAGRGIEHSEMPASEGQSSGIQLWINLPQRLKKIDPDYQQVDSRDIPEREQGAARLRVIVGEGSPVQLKTPMRYLDVSLPAAGQFSETVPAGFRGLIYMVQGAIQVNGQAATAGQAVFFDDPGSLQIEAGQDSRFMLAMGQPHGEPIVQYGPYVD